MLDDDFDADERRRAVETIRENGKHLLAILGDILDLSKLEAGRLDVECVRTDVRAILCDVVRLLSSQAAKQASVVSIHLDTAIPEGVDADPTRLRQVLLNVIGNAVKFTKGGQVRVSCRRDESAERLVFRIADTGVGLTAEQAREVFEPFRQADATTTRKFGGTGLGLPLSRMLMQLMGGDLSFVDLDESGCRVEVVLPMLAPTEEVHAAGEIPWRQGRIERRRSPIRRRNAILDGMSVLAADDGADNRTLIRHILERAGARVEIVDDGAQAVEAYAAEPAAFDLVLLDMQMPVLDGYGAARKIRGFDPDVPIVALTAHALSSDRERCLAAGCTAYSTKPIRRRFFLELLARVHRDARRMARVPR